MLINADYRLSSGVSQAINRINTPSTANFAIGTGSLKIIMARAQDNAYQCGFSAF